MSAPVADLAGALAGIQERVAAAEPPRRGLHRPLDLREGERRAHFFSPPSRTRAR